MSAGRHISEQRLLHFSDDDYMDTAVPLWDSPLQLLPQDAWFVSRGELGYLVELF